MNQTNLKTYHSFTVKPMAAAMAKTICLSCAIHCRQWRAVGERFGRIL